jgi:hypothetical protein
LKSLLSFLKINSVESKNELSKIENVENKNEKIPKHEEL